ncbi:glutamine synthetase [Chromohalobacter salexigens]|uniref:glutamine synthetase family protein n=1 Tax=Chromohalobacter TaxID=42054 RepID=UPI00045CF1B3|nr:MULTISPECIES: glutamine synthetase family protein [Chromohalobacter]MCK2041729.1 glutamine synthetase family protein [Chromohalobacter moromii]MCT8513877.1 glutamine synthetase family protein [Chromohalobacter sp. TMW 2.2271]NWO10935.1 glutamine synthetase [Chromohalobacter salexigens]CDQ33307.1 Gamma-glutamylputrescine synthetase PuuA [Virgibacillus halodenitrificans]
MSNRQEHPHFNDWFQTRGITEVECLVTDLTGILKGKIMPAGKYLGGGRPRLPDSIFIQTVTGGYPDDDDIHFWNPAERDMELVPDPNAIFLVPWADDATAQIIHDCHYLTGEPVELSPRHVLKRVLSFYEARGWKPIVAPEVEFFLVKTNTDSDYPLEPPIGRNGRQESSRQSFSIDAVNEFDPLFEEMYDYCDAMNLDLDTLIHEEGAGQMEVNFQHGDPLRLADQVVMFKRALRETALRHGMYATFMAKPMANEPGSSMHLHQSLLDAESGDNLFAGENGKSSRLFQQFIGGLQQYLPSAMPLLAPNVNSYRRLMRTETSGSAPTNVEWGTDNRTVGLRVPVSTPEATRVENRLAGADANPYLVMAASLACGYLGMLGQLEPRPPMIGSAWSGGHTLPDDIRPALDMLSACQPLAEVLGERFTNSYLAVKRAEHREYFQVISSWEREHLLLRV